MGGCATKPKVLKGGEEKLMAPPPVPAPLQQEEKVAHKDVALASIEESPTNKNPSLGNLFIKESEEAKATHGKGTVNATDLYQPRPQEGESSSSAEETAPAILAEALAEKEAVKVAEIAPEEYNDALEKLPAPIIETDAASEKEAAKLPKEENTEALENIKQVAEVSMVEHTEDLYATVDDNTTETPVEKSEGKPEELKHIVLEEKPAIVAELINEIQESDIQGVKSGSHAPVAVATKSEK